MGIPILKLKNILLTSIQEDLTDQQALTFQSDVLQPWRWCWRADERDERCTAGGGQ